MPSRQKSASPDPTAAAVDVRMGMTVPALRQAILGNLAYLQGRRP